MSSDDKHLAGDLLCAGALFVLLALTAGASFLDLGPLSIVVALGIAGVKALLIAAIFMDLREASPLTRIFAAAGVYWLLILIILTVAEVVTRS